MDNDMAGQGRLGSLSIHNEKPFLVINEPLAFVYDQLETTPVSDIKACMLKFYPNDMIANAKNILWENYSSHLPPTDNRRDTPKRKAVEADCDRLNSGCEAAGLQSRSW